MEEYFDQFKKEGKCCICEGTMSTTKYLNLLVVEVTVPWASPSFGNVYQKGLNLGCAYTCDACFLSNQGSAKQANPKFVVEYTTENKFIFHPVVAVGDQYTLIHAEN